MKALLNIADFIKQSIYLLNNSIIDKSVASILLLLCNNLKVTTTAGRLIRVE